jgi:hypothetical protein
MRQVAGIIALFILSPYLYAENKPPRQILDKIQWQISAKQWVTTQTALLSININVTLNSADLVKARSDIMDKLNKIAKGDWHLLEFNRSQDSSGLEKLNVLAQARVDQSSLTNIYQNAKSVSAPGSKYDVNAVEFKPSLEEMQQVKAKVREQLYQQVNDELDRMNKIYPTQKYSVNSLLIVEGDILSQSRQNQAKEMNAMVMAAAAPSPLTVSNELVLTALVEAASNRKQEN